MFGHERPIDKSSDCLWLAAVWVGLIWECYSHVETKCSCYHLTISDQKKIEETTSLCRETSLEIGTGVAAGRQRLAAVIRKSRTALIGNLWHLKCRMELWNANEKVPTVCVCVCVCACVCVCVLAVTPLRTDSSQVSVSSRKQEEETVTAGPLWSHFSLRECVDVFKFSFRCNGALTPVQSCMCVFCRCLHTGRCAPLPLTPSKRQNYLPWCVVFSHRGLAGPDEPAKTCILCVCLCVCARTRKPHDMDFLLISWACLCVVLS